MATHSYCFSAPRDGLENVGSALNSTVKENTNQIVALPLFTNFGNVCLWRTSQSAQLMSAFGGKADIMRTAISGRWVRGVSAKVLWDHLRTACSFEFATRVSEHVG